ncbi:hypothetical protein GWK78_00225 [Candidatus Saccharibacteria bacterium oral taxon 488]|nr:hypothetical protein GWK78_00225 [Candidatus Saccharibacteria bacterium oral taxon 488]
MTIQDSGQVNSDQDLASVLAGVSGGSDDNLRFEETGAQDADTTSRPTKPQTSAAPGPAASAPRPTTDSTSRSYATPTDMSLDDIKQNALSELRPLVGKLNVSPEEKFDTYLLLLRSTDDTSLIAPAHEAAVAIPDETRKAQALLDIIKEIDFLSQS